MGMVDKKDPLLTLCKNLDYKFKNLAHLKRALSHRSLGTVQSNERLEFLGDAVLNFTIGAELFDRYPKLREGDLSRLRANLVKGEFLAEMARGFELGKYLKLGQGEAQSGGEKRASILADAMEAVIGAIFLDAEIEKTKKVVLRWYKKALKEMKVGLRKDAKSLLQELVQSRKLGLPVYTVTSTEGAAHQQIFNLQCKVPGFDFVGIGKGTTKRQAEQEAAEKLFAQLKNALS
jgi:ribonuclease III